MLAIGNKLRGNNFQNEKGNKFLKTSIKFNEITSKTTAWKQKSNNLQNFSYQNTKKLIPISFRRYFLLINIKGNNSQKFKRKYLRKVLGNLMRRK